MRLILVLLSLGAAVHIQEASRRRRRRRRLVDFGGGAAAGYVVGQLVELATDAANAAGDESALTDAVTNLVVQAEAVTKAKEDAVVAAQNGDEGAVELAAETSEAAADAAEQTAEAADEAVEDERNGSVSSPGIWLALGSAVATAIL